jgi:hypothetical protein
MRHTEVDVKIIIYEIPLSVIKTLQAAVGCEEIDDEPNVF